MREGMPNVRNLGSDPSERIGEQRGAHSRCAVEEPDMPNAARTKTTAIETTPLGFEGAFDTTATARAALREDELHPINIDVTIALTTVLGALARLTPMRGAIAKALPTFDIAQFDALQTYAEALAYAQGSFLAFSKSEKELPALAAKAFRMRAQLVCDAKALAKRGLLDGRPLAALKGTTGFLNIASDLGVLVRVLRARWGDIQSRSAIQAAELDEAEELFGGLTNAYAARKHRSAKASGAIADRKRAFTLMMRAYDQAQRAVVYLRWNDEDADAIAPSLWAGRRGRRVRSKPTKQTDATNDPGAPAAIAIGSDGATGAPKAPEAMPTERARGGPFTTH